MTLKELARGADTPFDSGTSDLAEPVLETRFCAAPPPRTPVREPTFLHALMLAAWLGRLIDPADVVHHPVDAYEHKHLVGSHRW